MNRINAVRALLFEWALLGALVVQAGGHIASQPADEANADHSGHDMGGMNHGTEADEQGRRLFGMKHKVEPEIAEQLRGRVPLYANYSDAEIGLSMNMMGPNYAWYLSADDVQGKQGVLIL